MQKIVCLLEINEEEKAAFREAAGENEIVFINSGKREFVSSVSGELFADADVIIGQPKRSELKYAKKLKWLQARASGVDNYLEPGKVGDDVPTVSNPEYFRDAFNALQGLIRTDARHYEETAAVQRQPAGCTLA